MSLLLGASAGKKVISEHLRKPDGPGAPALVQLMLICNRVNVLGGGG